MRRVVLPEAVGREMVDRGRVAAPREACGVLVGRTSASTASVLQVWSAANRVPVEGAFVLDPEDLARIVWRARREGLRIVGFWHSHPGGPPAPSSADLTGCWPGHPIVIVALSASGVRFGAWQTDDGRRWRELSLELVSLPAGGVTSRRGSDPAHPRRRGRRSPRRSGE